jgi:hypothetical protein
MHRMRGAPLPLKAINEAKAEMERVVNVNYPTTDLLYWSIENLGYRILLIALSGYHFLKF